MTKRRDGVLEFEYSSFELLSSFGFRHSSFRLSRQSFPAAQTPLRKKASQRKRKYRRRVPQRKSPAFGDGHFAVRQAACELFQGIHSDHFAAGFFGNHFEQRTVWFQGTKFFGGQVGSPAHFSAADLRADRVRHHR